jgi:hypothetical protein
MPGSVQSAGYPETAAGTDGNLPKNSGLREIQRQRDEVELDLARLALAAARGEIIPVEAVRPVVERAYVGLRANLISLGGRIADQVLSFNTPAAAAQELIDGEIEAALAEVKSIFSSTDWVKAAVAAAPRRPGRKTKAEIMLRQQVTNGQDGQHS